MMNGYPKYIVSTTLEETGWNNSTIIKGNIAEEVFRLKQQPGKDVLIFGSSDLVNTLIQHGLIDEYRIMVFPIIVGSGKRLFEDGSETSVLRLVDTKTFGSGVVILTGRQERKWRDNDLCTVDRSGATRAPLSVHRRN
jgi:dihydrofolate reductase